MVLQGARHALHAFGQGGEFSSAHGVIVPSGAGVAYLILGEYYVFNIGGNKFRLIAAIHFDRQMVFIRHVFTHREYDKWAP